jgi:hypothetical protein
MRIEILLDPRVKYFSDLQKHLLEEIGSLAEEGVTVSTDRTEPPPGTLVVDEVLRFVVAHPEKAVILAKAILELARAALERVGVKGKQKDPPIVIVVQDKKLEVPASAAKQKEFLKALEIEAQEESS